MQKIEPVLSLPNTRTEKKSKQKRKSLKIFFIYANSQI